MVQVTCEVIWMRKILVGLFGQMMDPTMIYCDNQSYINLSKNPIFHDQSKHIDIWYHHLRDCVEAGNVATIHSNRGMRC